MTVEKTSHRLSIVSGAGAELSWLYAWASFLLVSCFQRLYPLPETVATFSLAALLTRLPIGRGWRVIQIIGIQLIGFALSALWIVHVFYYRSEAFWNTIWLKDFFSRPRGAMEGFLLFFVAVCTVAFWVAGIRFSLQDRCYESAASRFDRGMTAFFFLFLIKLLLRTQMGVPVEDSITGMLIFPFFLFGLTEIGLARDGAPPGQKNYLSGYRAIGVFSTFALGVVLLGGGLVLFFLPYLQAASEVGYDLMKSAARPLAPILIAILRFIFGHANRGPTAPGPAPESQGMEPILSAESSGWLLLVEKIVIWVGGGLIAVVGIAGVCIGLWYAVRWLFSRTSADPVKPRPRGWRWFLSWLKRIFYSLGAAGPFSRAKHTAADYFASLLGWGRRSGLPYHRHETPLEYGVRLAEKLPGGKAEIALIIELFQREVYGQATLERGQRVAVRRAWKRLKHPSLWSDRLKLYVKRA